VRKKERLRVDAYEVVCRAVEAGITLGVKRARGRTARAAARDALEQALFRGVMTELQQVIEFGERRGR
jgi:hypothetical protein